MISKNNLLFILYYCGFMAALVAVLAFVVITHTFGLVLQVILKMNLRQQQMKLGLTFSW
jgi:hypothetical protein